MAFVWPALELKSVGFISWSLTEAGPPLVFFKSYNRELSLCRWLWWLLDKLCFSDWAASLLRLRDSSVHLQHSAKKKKYFMSYSTRISQNPTKRQTLRISVLIIQNQLIFSLTVSFAYLGHTEGLLLNVDFIKTSEKFLVACLNVQDSISMVQTWIRLFTSRGNIHRG